MQYEIIEPLGQGISEGPWGGFQPASREKALAGPHRSRGAGGCRLDPVLAPEEGDKARIQLVEI